MSRLVNTVLFVFCVSVLSVSAVGCGESNEVIEDTRPVEEIEQETEDYEAMMEETADEVTE